MKEFVAAELEKFVVSEKMKECYFSRSEQSEFFGDMTPWKKQIDEGMAALEKMKKDAPMDKHETLARFVSLEEQLKQMKADKDALQQQVEAAQGETRRKAE